jgi:chitinase
VSFILYRCVLYKSCYDRSLTFISSLDDFHGTWNEIVGVNAPLYDQEDSEMMSVHGCVENWVNGGAPKEKINIGFPFYGRSFLGAKALYEEFGGAADESMWHEDEGKNFILLC